MNLVEAERALRKLKKERDEAVQMLQHLMGKIEGVTRKVNMSSVAVASQDLPVLNVGDFYKVEVLGGIAKLPGVEELGSGNHGWDADRVFALKSKTKRVVIGFHKVGNRYRLMKFCEEIV